MYRLITWHFYYRNASCAICDGDSAVSRLRYTAAVPQLLRTAVVLVVSPYSVSRDRHRSCRRSSRSSHPNPARTKRNYNNDSSSLQSPANRGSKMTHRHHAQPRVSSNRFERSPNSHLHAERMHVVALAYVSDDGDVAQVLWPRGDIRVKDSSSVIDSIRSR